jgi:hypothetical protein
LPEREQESRFAERELHVILGIPCTSQRAQDGPPLIRIEVRRRLEQRADLILDFRD